MNEIQNLIDQIPIKHNWISMIILCGWVQGFFLGSIMIIRSSKKNQAVKIFGIFLLFLSALLLDGYLCYTGLMKYTLHWNDSTEVLVLLLGPTIYFFIKSLIQREHIKFTKDWIHLIFPLIYFISQIPYYLAPIEVKWNAYIGAYFPDFEYASYDYNLELYSIYIKDEFRLILLGSFLFYGTLIIRFFLENKSKFSSSFWEMQSDKYGFSKHTIVLFFFTTIFIFIIFLNNENDGGDHLISILLVLIIFQTQYYVLSQSRFFDKSWVGDKYDTSGLKSNHQAILEKINDFMEAKKYYLEEDASLKDLAHKMNIPANYISQSINHETNQNFNDFINQLRIEEVKTRLGNSEYAHLNIAGIGKTVGFKSKSAFYSAFKKYTNLTPTQFLEKSKK